MPATVVVGWKLPEHATGARSSTAQVTDAPGTAAVLIANVGAAAPDAGEGPMATRPPTHAVANEETLRSVHGSLSSPGTPSAPTSTRSGRTFDVKKLSVITRVEPEVLHARSITLVAVTACFRVPPPRGIT